MADAPPYCSDQARCIADEACYAPLLGRQLVGFANESEAVEAATRSVCPIMTVCTATNARSGVSSLIVAVKICD